MTYLRRAPELLISWRGSVMVVQNFRTRRSAPATPLVVELLDSCEQWRSASDIYGAFPSVPRRPLQEVLSQLVRHTLLERTARRPADDDGALASWRSWSPEAACFHFGTKDVVYGEQDEIHAALVEKAVYEPPPSPVKRYRRLPRTSLSPPTRIDGLSEVLEERRTWRRFAKAPLDAQSVSTLLGLSWGVQSWVQTELGPCALKSSPSGGARHCTEVYVLVRSVDGLTPGRYYYDPDAHELVLIKRGMRARQIEAYLAGQSCYADVPAVFIMTAVFARMQWLYDFARAYRVVLLDAGHLCQTFCLVATALGLAPFCTAALADSRIERDLGLDGVTESVIYACGVSRRPRGASWAPWPHTADVPRLTPARSVRRSRQT